MNRVVEFITKELAAQKHHLFLWLPVFFALGIGIYFSLRFEPPMTLGFAVLMFLIAPMAWFYRIQCQGDIQKISFLSLLLLFLVCVGFVTAQVKTHLVYTSMLTKKIRITDVIGTIEQVESLGIDKGSRVVFKDVEIERLSPEKTPRKIRLKVRKDEGLAVGSRVKMLAGLNPPSPPIAPGAFDFQRLSYFKGIGAVGFVYNEPEIVYKAEDKNFIIALKTIRQSIIEKISIHTSEPNAAVVTALMTGQRSAITTDDRDAMRASGLAHLLAISGMHVGMVAGIVFFFARLSLALSPRLALKYPIKKWAAVIALICACLYTVMVGATIPTQRALMMTGLVLVAVMVDRTALSLRLVALAAFVVLLLSPESLVSVSFQMSFAAVIALICFYEWIRPVWVSLHRKAGLFRRISLYFVGVTLTTVIAGGATGLFSLYHFQNYAVWGVVANMIAVPLMAFIVMPAAVFSYLLMPFGLEGLTLPVTAWGVEWILATAHWTAGLDGALLLLPTWSNLVFIAMVGSLLFFTLWQGRLRLVGVSIFSVCLLISAFYRQPDIQIVGSSDLIAVRDAEGDIWFSSGTKERYAAENLLRRNGQDKNEKQVWRRGQVIEDLPFLCDTHGCRGEIAGKRISVAYDQSAAQEDCNWADIVIAQVPVEDRACKSEQLIDYFDLWRNGAHAIWLSEDDIRINTVEAVRGKRPWRRLLLINNLAIF